MDRLENHPLLKEKKEWRINLGLDRVITVCKKLGNPHLQFPSIIVGGTNGKGFVVHFLHHLLLKSGLKVGSYYSPHLEHLTERIRIKDRYINEDELLECMDEVYKIKRREGVDLTYFESLTCSAFLYFSKVKPDIVILEVGLGGRLDATNIVDPEISVITNVSYDHENFLGNTIEQIAEEKAGIVRKGKAVLIGENNPIIITSVSRRMPSQIKVFGRDFNIAIYDERCNYHGDKEISFKIPEVYPETFTRNIALSLALIECIGIKLNSTTIEDIIQKEIWPGRMELIKGTPSFLVDGGHNPSAVGELLKFIEKLKWKDPIFLVSFMKDKRIVEILNMIREHYSTIYAVPMPYDRSWNPENYRHYCDKIFSNPYEGLMHSIESGRNIVISGSLYLVGILRKKVLNYTGTLPLNLK